MISQNSPSSFCGDAVLEQQRARGHLFLPLLALGDVRDETLPPKQWERKKKNGKYKFEHAQINF